MSRRIQIGDHKYTELSIRFYDRYRFDPELNAARAYREVFPNCKTIESSWVAASRLLSLVKGRAYFEFRAKEELDTTKIKPSIDRVLEELNIGAYFNPKRLFGTDDRLKSIHELPDDVARAITSIKHTKRVENIPGKDKPVITYYNTELKLLGKKETLELIGKHLVMFTEKFLIETEEAMHERIYAEIRAKGEEAISRALANYARVGEMQHPSKAHTELKPDKEVVDKLSPEYMGRMM